MTDKEGAGDATLDELILVNVVGDCRRIATLLDELTVVDHEPDALRTITRRQAKRLRRIADETERHFL